MAKARRKTMPLSSYCAALKAARVREIFVRRDGKWTNPGWQTDSGT